MRKVLIVDDEVEVIELLKVYFKNNYFQVFEAHDGLQAFEILEKQSIDIMILDIMMPKIDGFSLIKKLRERYDFPIMFLSARDEDMDKIMGLGLGADDYMTKPFNPMEVIARLQALLRRYQKPSLEYQSFDHEKAEIVCGDLSLNNTSCEIYKKGRRLELTSIEYKLLSFMMLNCNRVFTKQQLYENVWGYEYMGDENIIMVYISKLRDKVEEDSKNPKILKTIRGLGYKLERNI